MRWLIDLFTNFFEITGNSIVDTILFTIIEIVAFSVAFGLVGIIFDTIGFYDSDVMSDAHWFMRLGIVIVISVLLKYLFKSIYRLFHLKWYVYLISFLLIVLIISLFFIIKYRISKKKNVGNKLKCTEIEESSNDECEPKKIIPDYSRNYCPKCGGKLVKRYGRFGDFYGCKNYFPSNCKYTRKYK